MSPLLVRTALATATAATLIGTPGLVSTPAANAAALSLRCHASMSNAHPAQYTTTHVLVHTVRRARVRTVAHYKTTNTVHRARANRRGFASIAYYVAGATPGYRVRVTVTVRKNGRVGHCATAFTPHK